ncbi:MAG: tocopherol cyclase family protein [Bacteroidetes bacterium]|nr:tocopherol cyclase family protein [Bacteroidota bacterium]
MFNKLHAFFNPEQYHGWGKRRNYFEGWYFKVISADEQDAYAFIPGIAMDAAGHQHSFIQVLDGKKKTANYHRFDSTSFKPAPKKFEISIEENFFSSSILKLDLPGISGTLHFTGQVGWPKPWYSPGIMGPFSFVPFMECYHGIVSMDHTISGKLNIEGKEIDFTNGRGYMEKDWGHSFPSAYFWMQSNHFSTPGISLKCSVAKIPWMRSSFVGFIAGVWLGDRLIRFTTYNRTTLKKSFADEKQVLIVLENKKHLLEITAHRDASTELASPIRGFMEGRIEESMTAVLEVKLTDKKRKTILLHDKGRNAGLEVAGNIQEIIV